MPCRYTLLIKPDTEEVSKMYENHSHFHPGDAGIDLFSPDDIEVKAGETIMLNFGIHTNMICEACPEGEENRVSYCLYLRSSTGVKTPLRLANHVGIFDAGYTGNVIAALDNIKDYNYTIKKGDRICQICHPTLLPLSLSVVDELQDSTRGEGGFGSTGV